MPEVKTYLTDAAIEKQFDRGYHLKHVGTILRPRVRKGVSAPGWAE